jgi:hypothetical protein
VIAQLDRAGGYAKEEMLNLAKVNDEIGLNDSYFMGSSLSEANATYLSAAIFVSLFAWLF